MGKSKYIRIRGRVEEDFEPGTEQTVDVNKALEIKAITARLKGTDKIDVRAYLFCQVKWDVNRAKEWVRTEGKTARAVIENIMPVVEMAKTADGEIYEVKAHCLKLKDIDERGKFQALGAFNGNIDDGRDRYHAGNWKKTIVDRGRQFPLLFAHMNEYGIGSHWPKDTREGLFLDPGQLDLSLLENGNPMVPKAVEGYSLYKNKHLDTFSVGWLPVKKEINKVGDVFVRDIFESKLFEVSMVPVAMNDQARLVSIKSNSDIFGYIIANLKDKDLKYRIFSLYYEGLEPEYLEATLQKAAEDYFSADEIASEEPEEVATPPEVVEPKQRVDFYRKLQKKLEEEKDDRRRV